MRCPYSSFWRDHTHDLADQRHSSLWHYYWSTALWSEQDWKELCATAGAEYRPLHVLPVLGEQSPVRTREAVRT